MTAKWVGTFPFPFHIKPARETAKLFAQEFYQPEVIAALVKQFIPIAEVEPGTSETTWYSVFKLVARAAQTDRFLTCLLPLLPLDKRLAVEALMQQE